MPPTPAVIVFTFSPITQVGTWNVRLETIALAVVVFVALVLAALVARRTPVDLARPAEDAGPDGDEPNRLRADDLLFIAVAALPGAVAGGRLGYAFLHLDYYRATPGALLDVTQGGFELSLAVVGGTLTAATVAALLGGPVGRWMHAAILPLLLALAAGKLAMVLGGDGQGSPFDGTWATAYAGPGPWGSLAPALPSHPSQVYEALSTGAVALVILIVLAAGAFRRKAGGAFLVGIALWALARAAVATTWRDPAAFGSLGREQLLCVAIAAGATVLLLVNVVATSRRGRPAPAGDAGSGSAGTAGTPGTPGPAAGAGGLAGPGGPPPGSTPDWPDPSTRPRI